MKWAGAGAGAILALVGLLTALSVRVAGFDGGGGWTYEVGSLAVPAIAELAPTVRTPTAIFVQRSGAGEARPAPSARATDPVGAVDAGAQPAAAPPSRAAEPRAAPPVVAVNRQVYAYAAAGPRAAPASTAAPAITSGGHDGGHHSGDGGPGPSPSPSSSGGGSSSGS